MRRAAIRAGRQDDGLGWLVNETADRPFLQESQLKLEALEVRTIPLLGDTLN
jgi:hypothetical protein